MRLRSDGVTWREVDEEAVLLDLHSSTYFRTNPTGTLLLRALVEGCDRDTLVALLSSEFDLSSQDASTDVDAFLSQLRARALLIEDAGNTGDA